MLSGIYFGFSGFFFVLFIFCMVVTCFYISDAEFDNINERFRFFFGLTLCCIFSLVVAIFTLSDGLSSLDEKVTILPVDVSIVYCADGSTHVIKEPTSIKEDDKGISVIDADGNKVFVYYEDAKVVIEPVSSPMITEGVE